MIRQNKVRIKWLNISKEVLKENIILPLLEKIAKIEGIKKVVPVKVLSGSGEVMNG